MQRFFKLRKMVFVIFLVFLFCSSGFSEEISSLNKHPFDLTPREMMNIKEFRELFKKEGLIDPDVYNESLQLISFENLLPRIAYPTVEICIWDPYVIYLTPPPLEDIDFPCLEWKKEVYWITPKGKRIPYASWPLDMKKRLNELFQKMLKGDKDLGLKCPDPKVSTEYLTEAQAKDVYLAHVAHALYLEYTGKGVGKLYSYPEEERAQILSPEAYHQPIPSGFQGNYPPGMGPGVGYRIPLRQGWGLGMICDPRVGYEFMKKHNLIGKDERETLIRLTAFFRDEFMHGGQYIPNIAINHVLLKDRLVRFKYPNNTAYWAIAGCHSAGVTFYDLARSVNIPLLLVGTRDSGVLPGDPHSLHTGLLFHWTRPDILVLQHVDDIYAISDFSNVFPIVQQGTGWREATTDEKDELFFKYSWVSPNELKRFGFEFNLSKIVCTRRCGSLDYSDFGWDAGGWRVGSREVNDKTYYAELMNGFQLMRRYYLGEYQFLSWEGNCSSYNPSLCIGLWQHYINLFQGQPSPLNWSWKKYRQRAQTIISTYGGWQRIERLKQNNDAYKVRP